MLGPRGKTWLIIFGLIGAILASTTGFAATPTALTGEWDPAVLPVETPSPADRPLYSKSFPLWVNPPNFGHDAIRFPGNLELRISFLYRQDPTAATPGRPLESHPLFKYSMDYGMLPNLQVGFTGFLYHPTSDPLTLAGRSGRMVLGWGPGLKYDLGRWSFTFTSQLTPKQQEQDRDLQNWFRVWYAF